MNTELCDNWTGFSASIPGSGHIRHGLPCQDASAAVTSPRPALIVCDGRGSAARSQDGAQAAVKAFLSQIAVFEPMLASILDNENDTSQEQWQMFARIMYRTLMQTKLDLARETQLPEKEFDFTVAFAITGSANIGCFQVGDGAIVLRQNGCPVTAFPPDKGEFANQTHFLRENGERSGKYHTGLFAASENTGVAITSDGPEHLMFKLNEMTPGRIFGVLFDDLYAGNLCRQDIMDYLTRREWENDPRGGDDRSLAILVPLAAQHQDEAAQKPGIQYHGAKPEANEAPAAANADDKETVHAAPETEALHEEDAADEDGASASMAQNENPAPLNDEKASQDNATKPGTGKSIASIILICFLAINCVILMRDNKNLRAELRTLTKLNANLQSEQLKHLLVCRMRLTDEQKSKEVKPAPEEGLLAKDAPDPAEATQKQGETKPAEALQKQDEPKTAEDVQPKEEPKPAGDVQPKDELKPAEEKVNDAM